MLAPLPPVLKPLIEVAVQRPDSGPATDTVINEVPVALQYNGISHVVMLCTPQNLDVFGLGFSLSEGILTSPNQLYDTQIEHSASGITVAMEVASEAFSQLKYRRRSMTGRTGCGICGVDNLAQVQRDIAPLSRDVAFPLAALYAGIARLPEQQTLQKITGAVHAACHVDAAGNIAHVCEDVGRHNALDKTLGSIARQGNERSGAIIVTSRASLEMVQKTATLGFAVLAAVSAPTAAAIELADRLHLSLIGFLRGNRCVVYTHPQHLSGV